MERSWSCGERAGRELAEWKIRFAGFLPDKGNFFEALYIREVELTMFYTKIPVAERSRSQRSRSRRIRSLPVLWALLLIAMNAAASERYWTWRSGAARDTMNLLMWNGSGFVAVGPASGATLVSTDGKTWTSAWNGTSVKITAGAWAGSRYVAFGRADTALFSPDGYHWTKKYTGLSRCAVVLRQDVGLCRGRQRLDSRLQHFPRV